MTFQYFSGQVRGLRGPGGQGEKGDPGSPGEGYGERSSMASAGNTAANGDDAYLTEPGREGKFVFRTGDQSAGVTADPGQGVYVAKASDPTGATGAWVRQFDGPVRVSWFGSTATSTATKTALNNANSYRTAFPAALILENDVSLPTSGGGAGIGPAPIQTVEGASLSGNVIIDQSIRVRDRVPVAYDSGAVHFDYVFGRKWRRPLEERESPLQIVTDAALKIEAIDMTTLETSRWPADSSDTWTTESPTKDSDSVDYSLTADSNWHVTWVPVQGGMDVTAFMKGSGGGCVRGVFIRTSGGLEGFYAPDGLAGNLLVKLPGVAPSVTSGITWLGRGTLDSQASHKSLWTVRVFDSRKWVVMLNGTEIFPVREMLNPGFESAEGEIVAVGFGVFGAGSASISVKDIVRRTTREQTGAIALHGAIAGNSASAPDTHGCWEPWMVEALDGAMGLRVLSITNLAESGHNTSQIAAQIGGGALGPSNFCVIGAPEINDIQQGAPTSTTVGNIGGMIDTLLAATVKPLLVTGYLWYSQALAGGQGEATAFYAEGAETRAALRRLAATKGIDFFDLSEISGPVLPAYLANAEVTDAVVRDNIHPTAWFYRRIGEWVAKAVLRAYRPKMTCAVFDAAFPTGSYSWMANGWTATGAVWSLDDSACLSMDGLFTAGTKTPGTTVFTLPPSLRPSGNRYLTCSTDAAATGTAPILQCQADGQCKIYGLDPTATFIRINGGFFTALAAK